MNLSHIPEEHWVIFRLLKLNIRSGNCNHRDVWKTLHWLFRIYTQDEIVGAVNAIKAEGEKG